MITSENMMENNNQIDLKFGKKKTNILSLLFDRHLQTIYLFTKKLVKIIKSFKSLNTIVANKN